MTSPATTAIIKNWVHDCTTSHPLCKPPDQSFLPSRLIDVGDERSKDARLILTRDASDCQQMNEKSARYIALSYCWGLGDNAKDATEFTATPETIQQHLNMLPIQSLPRTILDAIAFTRRLGVRYLWVDSLCIIQGNSIEAREDWMKESPLMAEIYGRAYLTIASTWAKSMHDGIFITRPSDPEKCVGLGLRSLENPRCKGVVKLVPKHDSPVDSMDEPLHRRAWALQERILSRRVLICNRDQLVWECQSCCFTESGFKMRGIGRMRLDREFLDDLESNDKAFQSNWACVVTDYCHKCLTNPSDKLPAIGGLAKKFHLFHPEDEYLAGLWKESILHDLLWVHKNYDTPSNYSERCKPQSYRAPSWSWASVDGGVRWMFSEAAGKSVHARLLDHRVTTEGRDVFGMIKYAHITLQAPLWKLPEDLKNALLNTRSVDDCAPLQNIPEDVNIGNWQSGIAIDAHWEDCSLAEVMQAEKAAAMDFYFLGIRDDISLILSSPKVIEEGQDRYYERVGIHGDSVGFGRGSWREGLSPCFVTSICKLV